MIWFKMSNKNIKNRQRPLGTQSTPTGIIKNTISNRIWIMDIDFYCGWFVPFSICHLFLILGRRDDILGRYLAGNNCQVFFAWILLSFWLFVSSFCRLSSFRVEKLLIIVLSSYIYDQFQPNLAHRNLC